MRTADLFAGAGGWSTAAARVGLDVVAAVNHWPTAVATHQANHPTTAHHCASLHGFDPRVVSPSPVVVLASPSCTGHTPARGKDRPQHDEARATAHAVVDLVEYWRPDWLLVENVPAMLQWSRYPAWKLDLECLGYRVAHTVLDTADFGFPQHRKRVYIAATRTSDAIRLPTMPLFATRSTPVSSVIDWTNPGPEISSDRFGAITMAQIAAGRIAYGDRFMCPYYGSQRGKLVTCSTDKPCGTVTTHDRYLVVNGDRARFLSVRELMALQGFPSDYILCGDIPDQKKQAGNAVHVGMGEIILRSVLGHLLPTTNPTRTP